MEEQDLKRQRVIAARKPRRRWGWAIAAVSAGVLVVSMAIWMADITDATQAIDQRTREMDQKWENQQEHLAVLSEKLDSLKQQAIQWEAEVRHRFQQLINKLDLT